ncbi:S-layer homology domain-containing protein [Bacillus sp. FJAT-29790]|uniref:phosphodiester glycosidase family protein n=1 Tax=Bacillus sp. FJAT-29790 TaxID=1895002 RepID=UPI001C2216AD|nr:phosphodiester glycosidase family protein [Bacillus sp. FJAT-29790]MBU8881147.1 S-layer homology domain-containing protein [Bacillus sp. FJAT-29790]
MFRKMKQALVYMVVIAFLFSILPVQESAKAATAPKEQYTVTPGVIYKDYRFNSNSLQQAARILDIDLNQPNVKVEAGIPQPLTNLATVSSRAKSNTVDQHHVVGAINASFFHSTSRLPAYLVAWKNDVATLGVISTGLDEYMSVPTAFGVTENGTALIDTFAYDSYFEVNGERTKITSINKAREANEINVFTPTYSYASTRSNSYGMEIVVTNTSVGLDEGIEFGNVITGTVHSVTSYGQGDSAIPKNGYVISIQGGDAAAKFGNIKVGQPIQLNVNVDNKWKNAEFMIASGPMLVKNGKVDMTINETSARAKERHPRTAVAIDSTGKKVFFVTVDGRQPGYSSGMNLKEFAQYLISIGADRAINLDGGGSTTMVARKHGDVYPVLMNSPSGVSERTVSTILQVVSTAPYGDPTAFYFKKSNEGTVLKGSSIELQPLYALDQNFHRLSVDSAKVEYSVEGNVGVIEGNRFIATTEGSGHIVGRYGNSVNKVPVNVTETPSKITISPGNTVVGPGTSTMFSVKAYDEKGNELAVSSSAVKWWATNNIGTFSADGLFTASEQEGSGKVQATIFNTRGETNVTVGNKAELINTFDQLSAWKGESSKAATSLSLSAASEPRYHGTTALKMSYDFSVGGSGIAASYAAASQPFVLNGRPDFIGMWVYGDGNKHWLRGKLLDGSGKEHTVNFTEEGKLDWKGWKYVKATVPAGISLPIKFSKLYVAEAYPERQGKGVIYFDKLQAEYGTGFKEPIFNDVSNGHWAKNEIAYLTSKEIITGYSNGSFLPENRLTRAHAAVLLVRALDLPLTNLPSLDYKDVNTNSLYYKEIAAVTRAGIMNGSNGNTIFNPEGTLTRAQMAAILARAYKLNGTISPIFNDVPSDFWAHEEIHALAANKVTTGYEVDHTFRPNNPVTRGQFSAFLYRILTR